MIEHHILPPPDVARSSPWPRTHRHQFHPLPRCFHFRLIVKIGSMSGINSPIFSPSIVLYLTLNRRPFISRELTLLTRPASSLASFLLPELLEKDASPSSSSLFPHFELPCFLPSSPRHRLFPPWPATSSCTLQSTEAARVLGGATLGRASASLSSASPPVRPKAAGSTSSQRTSEERRLLPTSAASPTSPECRLAVPSSPSASPPCALPRPHLHPIFFDKLALFQNLFRN